MSKKSLLTFLLFSLSVTFQLFAQTADEQFLAQIEKNLDLSALKDNPVLDYAQSDSVINSINQESDSSFKARFYNLLGQLNFEKSDYAISLEYFLTAKDYVITSDSKKELGAPTYGESSYGFGLSSAKKVTEALNGKLWLESELNVGSTFFFELENGQS